MTTKRKPESGVALRLQSLAHNARWHRDGVRTAANVAAGGLSVPALLRKIAKYGAQAVTFDEWLLVVQILEAVAEGRDVADELRIDRPKVRGRPKSPMAIDVARAVDLLIADGWNPTEAYDELARIRGTNRKQVQEQCKVGRAAEADIKRRMQAAEDAHEAARRKEK